MADFNTLAGFIPVATSLAGMFISNQGSRQAATAAQVSGERQRVASQFEAAQLEQQSGQSVAVSIQQANEQRRQAVLVQSRALALAAASGSSASDTSIVKLLSRQAGEGAYRAGVVLYQGEERARLQRMSAVTKRYEGDLAVESAEARADAYRTTGTANLLTGAGSLFAKYGMGGPTKAPNKDADYSVPSTESDFFMS